MTQVLDILLPSTPDAPATARTAISDLLGVLVRPQIVFDVRLLVSELVTNSVRHAGLTSDQAVRLIVEISPEKIRCEIHDPGPGFSVDDPPARGTSDGGWGLHLVSRLTDHWGIERGRDTQVWFEIDLMRD